MPSQTLKRDLALSLLAAAVYACATLLLEKTLRNNGFGDDGERYANWARDFVANVVASPPDRYYLSRILPSFLAWAMINLSGAEHSNQNILLAFQMMNIALFFAGVFAWCRVARLLSLSPLAQIAGVLLLFGSCGVFKWTSYYPVLPELWGFSGGFLVLWLYLSARPVALALVAAIGAFAWPTFFMVTAPLLIFAREPVGPSSPASRKLSTLAGAAIALFLTIVTIGIHVAGYYPAMYYTRPIGQVLWLSIPISAALAHAFVRILADAGELAAPKFYLRALLTKRTLLALAVLAPITVAGFFTAPQEELVSLNMLMAIGYTSTAKPAISIVAHVLWFGPIALVLYLRWRAVSEKLHAIGAGLTLAVLASLPMVLGSESRHAFMLAALLLPFAIQILDEARLGRGALVAFAVVSLLYSRIWLPFGGALGDPREFPAQLVYMIQGPWMANATYLAQAIAVGATALFVARILR